MVQLQTLSNDSPLDVLYIGGFYLYLFRIAIIVTTSPPCFYLGGFLYI